MLGGLTLMIEILWSFYEYIDIVFDATKPCKTHLKCF